MSTLVSFHAHPDDECLLTGGTLARLAAEGHRVVLVTATTGEEGEYPDGFVATHDDLASVRRQELFQAAEILGVAEVYLLGYRDSGMAGTPANQHKDAFCNVEQADAAARLAKILEKESADALTIYDPNGGYGHPDHIQVHHVGLAAAQSIGLNNVLQATMNRDFFKEMIRLAQEHEIFFDEELTAEAQSEQFGSPAKNINLTIDVHEYVTHKRNALLAHKSQIGSAQFALGLDHNTFAHVFAQEWYIAAPEGDDRFSVGEIFKHRS